MDVFLSMKVPQWRQNRLQKNTQKLGKNPAQDQQNKTMKMVSNIMVIMIIIMGLSLPIAMGIYWFITALIALGQTLLTQKLAERANKKAKYAKYKTK